MVILVAFQAWLGVFGDGGCGMGVTHAVAVTEVFGFSFVVWDSLSVGEPHPKVSVRYFLDFDEFADLTATLRSYRFRPVAFDDPDAGHSTSSIS
jgi:hypothetical protein